MKLLIFAGVVATLAWLCRHQLRNPGCHGFYRFFAFCGIAWLLVFQIGHWNPGLEPSGPWVSGLATVLLLVSLGMIIAGVWEFRVRGGQRETGKPRENFQFENTRHLVTTGIYRYIRHPMYGSLLFLAWGIFLEYLSGTGLVVVMGVSLALYLTARMEERENLAFFGEAYERYSRTSKLFLPFLI